MKKLPIHDVKKNYYIDELTCFEHPIAVIMNYYGRQGCALYLILSKVYGIYYGKCRENIREMIFKSMKEIFGIDKVDYGKVTADIIKRNIDKGNPVIVGVNLKNIFYSDYYMKNDWGHWILVNGYDEQNKTFNIVDNTQFGRLGAVYDDFIITYDMLFQAAKEYRKKFGKEYVCFTFEQENNYEPKEALACILNKYMNIDIEDIGEYRQIHLLEMLNELAGRNSESNRYYSEEFKKKIININKYRVILFNEIADIMTDYGYHIEKLQTYGNKIKELFAIWDNYILLNLVKASRGRFIADINNNIVNMEKEVQNEIREFVKHLNNETNVVNISEDKRIDCLTYEKLNDAEHMIYGTDE